jgi:diguanylate cyclase (GGDEF)-like protein
MAVAALVMLAIAILGLGLLTSKTVKEVQLMRDAETTALRWAEMFKDRRDDTWTTFRQRRSSKHANSVIWTSREVGRILAYELYDRNGRLFYSTGPSNWMPEKEPGTLLDSPVTRKHTKMGVPTTRLHDIPDSGSGNGPNQYASVVIPFYLADSYLGSIVAFVDQTEQAASLTYSFGVIAVATALLLLTAVGAAAYVVISKSRERWHAEARVRYLSDHDELTGLLNRHSFNKRLGDALASPEKKDKTAVIFLDINRFKEINDAMGHAAGDSVLRSVAERIHATLSDADFAARLGSNEFAIALTAANSASEVAVFASRLREILNAPYTLHDAEIAAEEISCTFSMGAAISPSDGDDEASLVRHANLALNRAKTEGSGAFKFFERSMDVAFQRRREREHDLHNAVERGEFELLFQPQICSATNTICGQALPLIHTPESTRLR